eukprot:TRINITY_DN7527_c0_g1_i3.p1 TRINITY_DN7527_c0_g1~~TRINITY_DN7527_c0_g1_i3.p1  ORF type:complete len:282 (-),score=78.08 TRINITY_DN7527_c0_g1_i3:94-939(-)
MNNQNPPIPAPPGGGGGANPGVGAGAVLGLQVQPAAAVGGAAPGPGGHIIRIANKDPDFVSQSTEELNNNRRQQMAIKLNNIKAESENEKFLLKTNGKIRNNLRKEQYALEDLIRKTREHPPPALSAMQSSLFKIWDGVKRNTGFVELTCRYKAENVYQMMKDVPDDDAVPEDKKKDWEKMQKKTEKEQEKKRAAKRKRTKSSSDSNSSGTESSSLSEKSSWDSDTEFNKKKRNKKRIKKERRRAKKKEEKKKKDIEELIRSAVTQVSVQYGTLPIPTNHF